jgi:predicted RNase H-like HicB family nuclease
MSTKKISKRYAVVFEQAATNWAAYVPDMPGCVTTGATLEEAEQNIREAISGHIRTLQEFGEPVPDARTIAKEIEITPAA